MNKKKICDVSIVCANYNNGKYLNEFIESVVSSTREPKELIIVDDGSKDDSLKILEEYKDLNFLKVISLSKNVGFANALNIGIKAANGKYILRIDPDDVIERSRIEVQCKLLDQDNNIDITGSNVIYFKEKIDKVVGSSNFPTKEDDIVNRYKRGEHGLLHGTVMAKAYLFKENSYLQSNVPAEDYDIFSRMIIKGAIPKSLDKKLTFVRIHQNSVSNYLPYKTVKKTYDLRDEIFKTKTSMFIIIVNFISLKFYRKYYFEKNTIKKLCFLIVSAFFRPDKAIKKII